MKSKHSQKLNEYLEKESLSVSPETVKEFSSDQEKKKTAEQKASSASILQEVRLIWDFLQDYSSGKYTSTTWKTVATLTVAMAYLISPFDLLPDFIIGLGLLDDALMIGIVVTTFRSELEKYKLWRESPQGKIRRSFL